MTYYLTTHDSHRKTFQEFEGSITEIVAQIKRALYGDLHSNRFTFLISNQPRIGQRQCTFRQLQEWLYDEQGDDTPLLDDLVLESIQRYDTRQRK